MPASFPIPPRLPKECVVEVLSEPTPELFEYRLPALAALLRGALQSGMEQTLPMMLQQLLDISPEVVGAEQQLILMSGGEGDPNGIQLARRLAAPPMHENLLHGWVQVAAKPVIVRPQCEPAMDRFMRRLGSRFALAAPLYVEHEIAGSLQLLRSRDAFMPRDAQLLWLLMLLTGNHIARLRTMGRLTHMAFTDFLTGLRTRGYFEQVLEQEVRRSLRRARSCCLLLVDLDDFKTVNDRFGHAAGDEVLRQVAKLLTRDMRDIDTVARFGGDEFSVLLPEIDADGAWFVALRLTERVRKHDFRLPEQRQPLLLGASIGLALCPVHARQPQALLRAADLALYQAKRQGKNRPVAGDDMRRAG